MRSRAPAQRPSRRQHGPRQWLRNLALLMLSVAVLWVAWVTHEIRSVAEVDDAERADAIAVFGAAEYNGRPSPVYHARLDHAVSLYRREIAPLVITLGGSGDPHTGNTEGGVGRDYLLANGVPFAKIVAETRSVDTAEQADQLAEIAHERNLHRVVLVSDGTHLFRIRELCRATGITVYTSPRPAFGRIDDLELGRRYFHEIVGYTMWRLGLGGLGHRWGDE